MHPFIEENQREDRWFTRSAYDFCPSVYRRFCAYATLITSLFFLAQETFAESESKPAEQPAVHEVVRTQSGIEVTESGGVGAPSTAAIRGATAASTPVYLGGVRLNDDVGGTADLSMVSLWFIDHVEDKHTLDGWGCSKIVRRIP
jgi:hypothetical protein